MKRCLALLGLLVTVLATTGVARADLFTAPVYLEPGDALKCGVTNISTAILTVSIEIKDPFGNAERPPQAITVLPDDSAVGYSYSYPTGKWFRCRFTGATMLKARAYGVVWNFALGDYTVSVPAE